MDKTNFVFAITSEGEKLDSDQREYLRKEYDLDEKEMDELTHGHLFRLSDYFRYWLFDADEVAWSETCETFYHLGGSGPIRADFERESIVAVVDENGECEAV